MQMTRALERVVPAALIAMALGAGPVFAAVVPKETPLSEKAFRQPELVVPAVTQSLSELPSLADGLRQELAELGVNADHGFFDPRSGRWSSLILSQPLIPGTGVGNQLRWVDLAASRAPGEDAIRNAAWNSLRAFVQAHQAQLRVDVSELPSPRITVSDGGDIVQIYAQRYVAGVPVRDGSLSAFINH